MNEQSVKAYMAAQGMAAESARVLVACSGGADSVALLHLLRGMEGIDVVCAHFNHCLRGAESDRDEAFVQGLCADWGISFTAGRGDVAEYAASQGLGIEEAAREKRYAFLQKTAAETGCGLIATAHTADDNAETVLFHLIRGTGMSGLCGIPPVRGNVIRPLLNVTRSEIEEYLSLHGLPHVEDSSNGDTRYARNALRHTVLPALERLNGAAVKHICAAAELLREDESYLDGLTQDFINENYVNQKLPISPLLDLPKPVAMRALRQLTGNPGRGHLERVYALCAAGGEHAGLDLPAGRVRKEGGYLCFGPSPEARALPRREVKRGETVELPEIGKSVRCAETEYTKEIHNSFNTFYFQSEKICGKISVGSRGPGNMLRPAGRNCTKTLKQLFAERQIPLAERAAVPVFFDEQGVIAVPGCAVAERCAPEPGKRAVRIELLDLPPETECGTEKRDKGEDYG